MNRPRDGHVFVRAGAGPWHVEGSACAPGKPDHYAHMAPDLGPKAMPSIGRVCEVCEMNVLGDAAQEPTS